MNNENSNSDNSEKVLEISSYEDIPQNYSGIVERPSGSKIYIEPMDQQLKIRMEQKNGG